MQERIAIKSGYQVSMHDRWWIHLTWDNFWNKFIWSKINYCQETLWKFHLKRVKKGELTAMNSLHSGLQNKDTYYLNQFYLGISNIDNSYKSIQAQDTELQQTAFLGAANRHWGFHPSLRHPQLPGALCFQVLLQSTPQAQSMCSTHQLQFTLPHLQVSDRGEHTPYSIHSSWQRGRGNTSIVSLNTFN